MKKIYFQTNLKVENVRNSLHMPTFQMAKNSMFFKDKQKLDRSGPRAESVKIKKRVLRKLDGVAPLIADHFQCNSSTMPFFC